MIPYSRQSISKADIKLVNEVLISSNLTKGPMVKKFENKIKKKVKCSYVAAVNSGTSALHLACMAIGIKKNDLVWTVSNTYAASGNCAVNCGAKIDFIDIDSKSFNISIEALEKKLLLAKKNNKLPKLLIPVHFAGQPTDQKKIWLLSRKYNFRIIEDASHSLGSKHYDEPVGSCKWSDITTFSFHPVKIITTGEGGAITTNNKKYYEKIIMLRENGITNNAKHFLGQRLYPSYYEQHLCGFNYRMNDISAALGYSQLLRLENFLKKRNQIANIYKKELSRYPVSFQEIKNHNTTSYHLLIIQFDLKILGKKFNQLFNFFKRNKIGVNLHYYPLHLQPFYKKVGFKKGYLPNTEDYSARSLSLPNYVGLTDKNLKFVIGTIKKLF